MRELAMFRVVILAVVLSVVVQTPMASREPADRDTADALANAAPRVGPRALDRTVTVKREVLGVVRAAARRHVEHLRSQAQNVERNRADAVKLSREADVIEAAVRDAAGEEP